MVDSRPLQASGSHTHRPPEIGPGVPIPITVAAELNRAGKSDAYAGRADTPSDDLFCHATHSRGRHSRARLRTIPV